MGEMWNYILAVQDWVMDFEHNWFKKNGAIEDCEEFWKARKEYVKAETVKWLYDRGYRHNDRDVLLAMDICETEEEVDDICDALKAIGESGSQPEKTSGAF